MSLSDIPCKLCLGSTLGGHPRPPLQNPLDTQFRTHPHPGQLTQQAIPWHLGKRTQVAVVDPSLGLRAGRDPAQAPRNRHLTAHDAAAPVHQAIRAGSAIPSTYAVGSGPRGSSQCSPATPFRRLIRVSLRAVARCRSPIRSLTYHGIRVVILVGKLLLRIEGMMDLEVLPSGRFKSRIVPRKVVHALLDPSNDEWAFGPKEFPSSPEVQEDQAIHRNAAEGARLRRPAG